MDKASGRYSKAVFQYLIGSKSFDDLPDMKYARSTFAV
jgi:hypothetical protein